MDTKYQFLNLIQVAILAVLIFQMSYQVWSKVIILLNQIKMIKKQFPVLLLNNQDYYLNQK